MSGKEYYEKYHDRAKEIKDLIDDVKKTGNREDGQAALSDLSKMVNEILIEMNLEVSELGELRRVSTKAALVSIAEDMNRRWNKMVSLFEKEFGDGILTNDGYMKFFNAICEDIEKEEVR